MVVNSLLSCAFLLLLQVPLAACSEWNGLQRYGTYLLRERITFINDTIVVQNDTQYDIHTTHVLSITGLVLADGVKPTIDGGSVPHPVPGNVPNKTGVRLFHVISRNLSIFLYFLEASRHFSKLRPTDTSSTWPGRALVCSSSAG